MQLRNTEDSFKWPRLFTEEKLVEEELVALLDGQSHYLLKVMRKKENDPVRLFNGVDGEWAGLLKAVGKKSASVLLKQQLAKQPAKPRAIHLYFAPIKKTRMDWLIEKSVELGVTDFHPILTHNTEVRKINEKRLKAQIFEAAEQCERFEIPVLHELTKAETAITESKVNILSCVERSNGEALTEIASDYTNQEIGFLIGPEGGFTAEEKAYLQDVTKSVSLGDTVLRCETAAVKALVLLGR